MNNTKKIYILSFIAIIIFARFLLVPIFYLIFDIDSKTLFMVLYSKQFKTAFCNSIFLSIISTSFSLIIGFVLAFIIKRMDIKLKALFDYIIVLPMLIPSISLSLGTIILFGANGLVSNLLSFNFNIYGSKGIIFSSILYSYPVAYIMFKDAFNYENYSYYKVADVLGVNYFSCFKDITIPYLNRTLLLSFFSVFTMIITDYGVPLMIGGKTLTLPAFMYNKIIGEIDYNTGTILAVILILPSLICFLLDIILKNKSKNDLIVEPFKMSDNYALKIISYVILILISILVLLPIISFVMISFLKKFPISLEFTLYNIKNTISKGAIEYMFNSILISIFVGALGTCFSFFCAYLTSRIKNKITKIIHNLCLLPMAVPGIVLGYVFLLNFNSSVIYGTIFIIIIVNILHFYSSPYILLYNSLCKINDRIEDVGHVLNISRFFIIKDIIIKSNMNTLSESFIYYFVNSMMTISAVVFLSPPAPKPLSIMINQFESQRLIECAAFVTIIILFINITTKLFLFCFNKKYLNKAK